MKKTLYALAFVFAVVSGAVHAHDGAKHEGVTSPTVKEQKLWGIAGDASSVERTVIISMTDAMRFAPDNIQVRQGETVRLVLRNDGRKLHEMVIGTNAELEEHAALMRKFPNMVHDEPYMAHVAPGETGEIVWQFNSVGDFNFACLMPGHYEAGMAGRFTVQP